MDSEPRISTPSTIETGFVSHAMPATDMGRNRRRWWHAGQAAAVIGLLGFNLAHGALIDRGGGLIYDTDLNITWLQQAQAVGGDWQTANLRASQYTYFDSVRGVTYDDWRLPTVLLNDPTCSGPNSAYGCTGSEMGHLFYVELGNLGYFDASGAPGQPGWGLKNKGPFDGLEPLPYWSGTAWDQGANAAYFFEFNLGAQDAFMNHASLRAMLVRDGDVAAVPAPGSLALALLGAVSGWFLRRVRTNYR